MDYRKIIKFGGTSHVVSLPNDWIKRNNLSKGDIVYFEENGDSEITIYPKEKIKKRELKEITIDANGKDIGRVTREIYSAYISNFNIITIFDNNLDSRSKEIRDIIHNLVALEIMGQTKNTILARDFLSINKISINGLIRRVDIIIKNMIADSILCIKEDRYKSVQERDNDINRIYFLVSRIVRRILEDPNIARSIKTNNQEALSLQWLFINLEKIGDECKRFCRYVIKEKLTKKEKEILTKIFKDIELHYIDIMKAYYTNDRELAYNVIGKKDGIINRCDIYLEENPSFINGILIEKLKGIETFVKTVGRIIINDY